MRQPVTDAHCYCNCDIVKGVPAQFSRLKTGIMSQRKILASADLTLPSCTEAIMHV